MEDKGNNWEKKVIKDLAFSGLVEQRKNRRWGIFFKALTFAYLLLLFFAIFKPIDLSPDGFEGKHTALVNLYGQIGINYDASADNILEGLRSAFAHENTEGVVLRINSPGGSPVQSHRVFSELLKLKSLHPEIPIYALVEDVCTSGAYYIAIAADKIFVDPGSVIGSIGVVMNGFGFTETMKKLGIERRLVTAGEDKAFLDPFSEPNEKQQDHIRRLLKQIHNQFVQNVKSRREGKLRSGENLFSGLIWTGEESITLGLVDEIGSLEFVSSSVIGANKIVDFTFENRLVDKIFSQLGSKLSSKLSTLVSEYF